jgi:predicted AAA+ superfamily ATPase
MALRNAVLKIKTTQDDHEMGHYAENVVVRELMSWPEGIEVSYYREKDREVDFVLTHGGNRYLPMEVKYWTVTAQIDGLRAFMRKFDVPFGCVVTRELERKSERGVLFVPLRYFLLAT